MVISQSDTKEQRSVLLCKIYTLFKKTRNQGDVQKTRHLHTETIKKEIFPAGKGTGVNKQAKNKSGKHSLSKTNKIQHYYAIIQHQRRTSDNNDRICYCANIR